MPEHESDFEHTFINTRGEMIVKKRLKEYEPDATDLVPNPEEEKWRLQFETLQKEQEYRLRSFSVNWEVFKPTYRYHKNEDKKEYRYTFNKDTPKYEW